MTMRTLIQKIAWRLSGMHKVDLTTAERQIVKLLKDAGYLHEDEHGNVVDSDVLAAIDVELVKVPDE